MKKQLILCASLAFSSAFAQNPSIDLENNQTMKNIFANGIVYRGLLPCADCQGIKVLLKFDQNSTFSKDSLYLSKDFDSFTNSGKYEIKGSIITTTDTNGDQNGYLFDNGVLKMLDGDGNTVSGELAQYYDLMPLDKRYYKGYYKQFIQNLGEANKTQSLVINNTDKINVFFYPNLHDSSTKCFFVGEGKFEDGILHATNDRNQSISLNLIDKSAIYVKELLKDGEKGEKICQRGSIDGLYDNSIELSNLISENSIGFINKFIPVSQMEQNIPKEQLTKSQNGDITQYTVSSPDKKPLFSFAAQNDKMKFVEVLSPSYATPQGISLKSTFGELKSKMTIDNVKLVDNEIYVECMDFNMVAVFKRTDLAHIRTNELNLDSIKDSAQISKIILEW